MNKKIRAAQRFTNFRKAYEQLSNAVAKSELSDLERSGLIQTFEYSFELACKTMKDYLESEGISAPTPRQSLKEAFKIGIIKDGHLWLDALEKRNYFSHCYDHEESKKAEIFIRSQFFPLLKDFVQTFEKKL
jgi:nucleotidyltransferase substrate binding protein (TIGR01987 family)